MGKTKNQNMGAYMVGGKQVIMDSCLYDKPLPCGKKLTCPVKVVNLKIKLHKKVCVVCNGIKIDKVVW